MAVLFNSEVVTRSAGVPGFHLTRGGDRVIGGCRGVSVRRTHVTGLCFGRGGGRNIRLSRKCIRTACHLVGNRDVLFTGPFCGSFSSCVFLPLGETTAGRGGVLFVLKRGNVRRSITR